MLSRWALVVADFRREYQCAEPDLARMSMREFWLLLRGLSDRSRFHRAWTDAPKHVYDAADIAAVKAAARR